MILHRAVSVVFFGFLVVLAGCATPVPDSPDPPVESSGVMLEDGWTYEASGGAFSYSDGTLQGSFMGAQLLLRVNSSQPIDLSGATWHVEGRIEGDEHASFPMMVAFWNEEDPWPALRSVSLFVREYAGAGINASGVSVREGVFDPQPMLFRTIFGDSGRYVVILDFPDSFELEAGDWRFWFAVPFSAEMDIEFDLPELVLPEPLTFGDGCGLVLPSEFDSTFNAHISLVADIVMDGRWSIDVPQESLLFGAYFGGGAALVQSTERQWVFPDKTAWSFERDHLQSPAASPSDWDGAVLASEQAGLHRFEVVREQSLVASQGPHIVYCVA